MPLASFRPTSELGSLIPYTCAFNLSGHPAVSIPNGFTKDGLPVGLQIIGRHYDDLGVLRLAREFEKWNPDFNALGCWPDLQQG